MLWWVVTLGWAALIFHLSTRTFSPSFSRGVAGWMLHFLHLQVSSGTFDLLHTLLRKLAHLTEYAIFALLLYGSPDEKGMGLWQPRRAVACIAIAAAYSLTDEFHQLFVLEDMLLSVIADWTPLVHRWRCWCLTPGDRSPSFDRQPPRRVFGLYKSRMKSSQSACAERIPID